MTALPRTFLDLSQVVGSQRLRRLVKDAEFRGDIRIAQLAAILERYPRRRGRGNLARIVAPLVGDSRPTRSPLEDRFLDFCRRTGLPLPVTNARLEVGGRVYEADCLWREARVVVELDGRDAHARELAFEDDRARDRTLAASGWVPVRVTSTQLDFDEDKLQGEIRDLLAVWGRPRASGVPRRGLG